jgi:hypothetical protein
VTRRSRHVVTASAWESTAPATASRPRPSPAPRSSAPPRTSSVPPALRSARSGPARSAAPPSTAAPARVRRAAAASSSSCGASIPTGLSATLHRRRLLPQSRRRWCLLMLKSLNAPRRGTHSLSRGLLLKGTRSNICPSGCFQKRATRLLIFPETRRRSLVPRTSSAWTCLTCAYFTEMLIAPQTTDCSRTRCLRTLGSDCSWSMPSLIDRILSAVLDSCTNRHFCRRWSARAWSKILESLCCMCFAR